MTPELESLIRAAAARHDVPNRLVRALVRVESSDDPHAMRYDPAFFERYVSQKGHRVWPGCSRPTEERLRAFSFGLMQIMGQTAREAGFQGPFLTALLDPATNLDGCRARQANPVAGGVGTGPPRAVGAGGDQRRPGPAPQACSSAAPARR